LAQSTRQGKLENAMPDQPLSIALGSYGITAPLKQGEVDTRRLKFAFVAVEPITAGMRRMVRSLEFDICEMAFTTYLCARDVGVPVTALPVFVTRNFHHWAAFKTARSGIKVPKDLEGRRVAVNRGYTVTTGLWIRGILQAEYGVDLDSITWVPTDEEHVAQYVYPANVDLSRRGKAIADLLLSGDCDAAIGDVKSESAEITPLIPDARRAGFDYFRRTGIYPINHAVVVRNSVLEAQPWMAAELVAAFTRARGIYYDRLANGTAHAALDKAAIEVRSTLGIEPFPFGIEANRPALEAVATFAAEQKITRRRMDVAEMFAG
jgi:4,5-dihydroxyphthalate decarboxylase